MASFNVGDIEGRLTLDRSPYTEGLRIARQQADDFERRKINPEVDIDTAQVDAQIAATEGELDRLDHKRATPTVHVNTSGGRGQVGLLAAAIVALGPAALAAGAIAAGALAPLAVGAVGIAAIALPALKELHDAATKTGAEQQKALAAIGPGALPAVAAFRAMTGAWEQFRHQLNPALFGLLRQTFLLIQMTLPAMLPFMRAFTASIAQLVHGLIPLAPTFGRAFTSMMPIVNMVTLGVLHLAQALAGWTAGQGFQHFIAYVVANGPLLWHTLGAVAGTIVQLGVAAGPVLPVMLRLATVLARLLTLILQIPGVGPALVTLGFVGITAWKVASAVTALQGAWVTFGTVFPRIAAVVGSSFGALFANPVVLGVAAAVAAIAYIATHWQQVGQFLRNLWQGLLDIYNNTLGLIPGMPHAGNQQPTSLQSVADDVAKATHGDKAAMERLRARKRGQQGPALPTMPTALAPPALTGLTGIITPDPTKPQTPYEGYNPITNRIEKHTPEQWRHIHVVNQKRQHDAAIKRGQLPHTQVPVEGVNPFTNQIEMHTSSEWRHIHNLYTQHQRQLGTQRTRRPRAPQTPREGFNRLTGRIEMHTPDQWHHIHVLEQQRTFNRTHGPTGLPRTTTHGFSDTKLGGDIVGQTLITHHPKDYGQRKQDKHTSTLEKNTRQLQRIGDLMEKDDRRGAKTVVKLDIGGRSEHIDTETRRRGRAPAKR